MKKIDFMKPEMQVIKMTAKTSLLQASGKQDSGDGGDGTIGRGDDF